MNIKSACNYILEIHQQIIDNITIDEVKEICTILNDDIQVTNFILKAYYIEIYPIQYRFSWRTFNYKQQ
jgi:hypothetical protein